ncbi:MAG: inverse autotransporter beta domain-containing protein [Parachlamydiales bacterium]|nr:inverse autotransporter beta domain-containing protein [Parachlamydiales bacterium]
MSRSSIFLLLSLASGLYAEQFLFAKMEPPSSLQPMANEGASEKEGPRPCRVSLSHLEYQGIGFDIGYSTLSLFLANPEPWRENSFFFLDLRGHVFNDGRPAVNAGAGWRIQTCECQAFGLNAYYDYRSTKRENYNQMGAGIEYLLPRWEFRVNGYFPFGETESKLYDLKFSHFSGHQFYVSRKHEVSMTGFDAEAGWHFFHTKNFDLYAGAGPYYFKGPIGDGAIGGKVRFEARMTPFVSIEIGDSYDSVFHNRFQASFAINIPFGPRPKLKSDSCCSLEDKKAFQQWVFTPPKRQEIIVVDSKKKTTVATSENGVPYYLIFVDNTSSSNGTFESPYHDMATAQTAASPGNIIYVFPGDGTTTGMNTGVDLSAANTAGVRLLSSGVSHSFETSLGSLEIPAQTSILPTLTNINPLPIVTLGLDNEIWVSISSEALLLALLELGTV